MACLTLLHVKTPRAELINVIGFLGSTYDPRDLKWVKIISIDVDRRQ